MVHLAAQHMQKRRSTLPVLAGVALFLAACSMGNAAPEADEGPPAEIAAIDGSLEFLASDGRILAAITIELSETRKEWAKGLMERREMGPMHGMLFIFDSVRPRGFWMRNTYIPLDIIFVDKNSRVVTIAENTTPFSETILPSGKPVKYVVEVNAGFSQKFHIEEGTQIQWRRR